MVSRIGRWIGTNTSSTMELGGVGLEQLRSAGMLLFGRVTYEGMAAYWQSA
jgi:hypothetical protein